MEVTLRRIGIGRFCGERRLALKGTALTLEVRKRSFSVNVHV